VRLADTDRLELMEAEAERIDCLLLCARAIAAEDAPTRAAKRILELLEAQRARLATALDSMRDKVSEATREAEEERRFEAACDVGVPF